MSEGPKWLTVEQAAAALDISKATVRRMFDNGQQFGAGPGRLTGWRTAGTSGEGGDRRIDPASVEAEKARRQSPSAEPTET